MTSPAPRNPATVPVTLMTWHWCLLLRPLWFWRVLFFKKGFSV